MDPDCPVFLERYNAEAIRDSVAELAPIVWQGFPEEPQNGLRELIERGVVVIMGDPFVHDAPETFDWVEMWGIGRQKVQLHPPLRAFKPWLEYLGVMIAGIVQEDMDGSHGWVVALQLCQQHLSGCLDIDLLTFHEGELEGFKIKRTLNVEPLSA